MNLWFGVFFPLPQLRWQISAEGLDYLGRPQCHLCHQGLVVGGWVAGWLAGDHPRAGNSAGHYHWLCSGVEGARGTGSIRISQSLTFWPNFCCGQTIFIFFKSIKV